MRRNLSERSLAWCLEKHAKEAGAEKMAFDAIIASSKNAARPHHQTGLQIIKGNQLLILDFGVVIDGCPVACGKKIFSSLGIPFHHFLMTDYGVEKGKTEITLELIGKTAFTITEELAGERECTSV